MIRVLLVEDHRSFREALAFLLGREPDLHVVAQAGSLAEARRRLAGVDVAVLDLALPDGDGMELLDDLRHASPESAALVLSGSADTARLAETVDAGAAAAMTKSADIGEIVAAVRRLGAGEPVIPAAELELARRGSGRHEDCESVPAALTPREREVLQGLAEGLSGRQIAGRLGISEATERTHMENIRAKLGVRSQSQALVCAVRNRLVTIR